MIDLILFYIGLGLTIIGGVLDIIASIGFFRLKDFYMRLHAATVGTIGGGFYPLIGLAIIALSLDVDIYFKAYMSGVCLIAAVLIALGTPAGSHILARAAYHSGEAKPIITVDRLREDKGGDGE
ncbi:MAG: monovalent cation/H(+) antiporter subunit G [Desulfurococcus sp.]|uniref:monovalent cation/H(+) antiporter subunit G n=1 Tax=Desulfurococcus sp. TaxID=51678 RepID=UPI003D119BFE